ncbi:hypothetical protein CDO44_14940 [Pigmentiphaga sp. NML080357]|uniref:DUF4286 family protein n=1 Tax=Pigmentiphaga sp. NML080357 TaxID=2008675 RepID=UPI000B42359A|nr:DUF4286 family protein [Pigmentiphaga sp. NML080357]OVZ58279.1 hypothetical protein CDO44_14940 [Pigmentiphaga sp. NML080357]
MTTPAAILLRYSPAPADAAAIERLAAEAVARYPGRFERVDANRALDGSHLYLYFWSSDPAMSDAALAGELAGLADRQMPGAARDVLYLAPVQDLPGASRGETARYHYVVETDVRPEVAEDLDGWYAQEHLPGLAAVAGNIRARRLVAANADGSQRSLACYDLTTPAIKQDPAWLAVRATEWSGRVRPHFQNTRRVMCERVYALEPGKGAS